MLSSWAVETLIRPTRISKHNIYGINIVILFFYPQPYKDRVHITQQQHFYTVDWRKQKNLLLDIQ